MPAIGSAAFAEWLGQIDKECGPGTGPYRLDNEPGGVSRWLPRQQVLLVRNEHCWRRAAAPGTWNFGGIRLLVRDQAGADNALLRAPPHRSRQYRRLCFDYEALGVYRVVWNCRRGPCTDVRVRRALAMLFDVDAMVAAAAGAATPALAHAKRGSGAYPTDVEALRYDPGGARALLREAGFDPEQGRPLQLVVLALQGTAMLRQIADLLADAAQQAGVELDLRRRDYRALAPEKNAGGWDGMLVMQSFRPWGDPYDFVHSAGVDNEGAWSHADADRLATAAREERDPARRDALWRELHTLVYREQPVAFLVHPLVSLLLARRIEGAYPSRSGLVLERAFVAAEHQRQ